MAGEAKGPGIFFVLPCIDTYMKVDLRVVSFDVPPQEILTKDSVTVAVDAVVYFRISNPIWSVVNVEDAHRSTKLLAQTTLRNELGTKNLSDLLLQRDTISESIARILDVATDPWGMKVERVEVKDVRLPQQLQRAMAAEAEASREAKAKVRSYVNHISFNKKHCYMKLLYEFFFNSSEYLQFIDKYVIISFFYHIGYRSRRRNECCQGVKRSC